MKPLITTCLTVLLLCVSSFATTVERLSLDDMVRKAHSIVHGRVRSQNTHWSPDGRLILTTTTIDVEETLKGTGSRSIDVTTIGGRIGAMALHVSGMPSFEPGEEAVVFIENSAGYSIVVGLSQGKFSVNSGQVANGVTLKMGLEDFKRQIRSHLQQ